MDKGFKILKILVGILIVCIAWDFLANKLFKRDFADISDTDKAMFNELSKVFSVYKNSTEEIWSTFKLNEMPVILSGSSPYIINLDELKGKGYVQKIEMPAELNLPTVYRLCNYTPNLYKLFFFNTSGEIEIKEKTVPYIKYNENSFKVSTASKEYFTNFLNAKVFSSYMQKEYASSKGIKKYPKDVENYALLALEYTLLDKIDNEKNIDSLNTLLKEYVTVRSERIRKFPQLKEEEKLEDIYGSQMYVAGKVNEKLNRPLKEYNTLKIIDKYTSHINSKEGRKYFTLDSFSDTGNILANTLDKLNIDWKKDLNKTEGKTMFACIAEHVGSMQNISLDSIKEKYKFYQIEERTKRAIK
ncbi:MAG: hypothetical protein RSB51_02845 [Clostridia bacterium]